MILRGGRQKRRNRRTLRRPIYDTVLKRMEAAKARLLSEEQRIFRQWLVEGDSRPRIYGWTP